MVSGLAVSSLLVGTSKPRATLVYTLTPGFTSYRSATRGET